MTLIGIEGPALAGKSSVIREIAHLAISSKIEMSLVPCYVEYAVQKRTPIPPPSASTRNEALLNLNGFFRLDRLRFPHEPLGVTLLDRTPATFVAHSIATAALGAADVRAEANTFLHEAKREGRLPKLTFFLQLDHETQLSRSLSRPPMPELFLNSAFNAEFESYFLAEVLDPRDGVEYVILSGEDDPEKNARHILAHIRNMVK